MKTLTAELLTELGRTITRPGYLIEIDFSTPLRLSTIGEISYAGYVWQAADVQVRGISASGSGAQAGQLAFANTWDDFGAAILNEGIADRAVTIYSAYVGAEDDAVQVFSGVGDDAEWDAQGRISVRLAAANRNTLYWPRRRINAASGFHHLIPSGTRVTVGGVPYLLERR